MSAVDRFLKKISQVLKCLSLLFPSFIFLVVTWQCFWVLPQGKDIIIAALEKRGVAGIFLVAMIFFVFVTWYTGRVLVYRKKSFSEILYQHYKNQEGKPAMEQEDVPLHLQIVFNMPRLFGYFIFSLIWIGLLRLTPTPELGFEWRVSDTWSYILLALTLVVYVLLYRLAQLVRTRIAEGSKGTLASPRSQQQRKNKFMALYLFITGGVVVLNIFFQHAWLLLLSVLLLQLIFPFIVVMRRTTADLGTLPLMNAASYSAWLRSEQLQRNFLNWVMYHANIPRTEKRFFASFNIISLIAIIIYLLTIFSFSFSTWIGSFPFVMLAFGVLVGMLSIFSMISIAKEVNVHFFLVVLMVIIGQLPFEPHNVQLADTKVPKAKAFNNRPDLHQYFAAWMASRKPLIDSMPGYPVYFVLADGGASRSGYWTAGALGTLEDSTQERFSHHLFCLSGASGGSVGNGTFFALLHQKKNGQHIAGYSAEARVFLKEDFLTYTLGRMLGPDFARCIFPLPNVDDRAASLEHAMEVACTQGNALYQKMATPVSDMLPFQQNNTDLPILCVNTTRMQDGRPAIVTTIKPQQYIFGERIDVLGSLDSGKTMKLSTAVVLGARFPYVSPAGRINNSYYVDGGYFDNSGAGFVHEMLIELQRIIRDSLAVNPAHYYGKLQFQVIHIMNSPEGSPLIEKVHPLKNDLLAPALTMLGSYSTQTTVNNLRLRKYLEDLNKGQNNYIKINLYETGPYEAFPMNWTISNHYRCKMDSRLGSNKAIKKLVKEISLLKG